MAGLEVQIGADSSDLKKKIQEAELALKELSQVKLEQIKLGLDTKEINGNIASVKKSLTELKTVSKDTGSAISGIAPKVANGGNALMQFSRIAQDAPFGIMGIGNNITATAEAFSYLKNQTGSTGGALKAVASSMLGSGGILLAVSLVTTGLTYMAQKGISVEDVFDKLTGTFDKNAKALSEIGSEAAKNSKEEISSLNAYVAAASNVNLKMSDRLIAVKKLQDEYPAYFGNLTKEQILNGNVAGAVNKVTEALIQKAKAAAFSSRIADLAEKEFLLRQDEEKGINKLKKAYKDLETAKAKASSGGAANVAAGFGSGASEGFSGNEANANLEKAKSSLGDIQNELRSNLATQKLYTEELNKSTAAQLGLETETSKVTKTPKVKKAKKVKDTFDYQKNIDKLKEIAFQMEQVSNVSLFEDTSKTEANLNKLKEIAFQMSNLVSAETLRVQGIMADFSKSTSDLIRGAISETFVSLGTMIGNSMSGAGNGLEDAGKNILGIMGKFLSEFGKLMIETGTGLIIADLALKSGNGLAMIAGGVALVAIGAAFATSSAKAREKASSGFSGSTGGSYSSPSSRSGYSGGSAGGGGYANVVFEISGQKLLGVLNNTLESNKRLGGNLPIG